MFFNLEMIEVLTEKIQRGDGNSEDFEKIYKNIKESRERWQKVVDAVETIRA